MPFVQGTGTHIVPPQEVTHLQQRLPVDGRILHPHRHAVGLGMRVFGLLLQNGFLFLLQLNAADISNGNGRTNDTHHTEWISAGIARRDLRQRLSGGKHLRECFGSRTKSRRVRHRPAKHTNHHGQVIGVVRIKYTIIQHQQHRNVEHHDAGGQEVERDAPFLERLEEARPHLQADAIHKKNQAKVLQEIQGGHRAREAEMPSQNASKQHERHAQRNSEELDFT